LKKHKKLLEDIGVNVFIIVALSVVFIPFTWGLGAIVLFVSMGLNTALVPLGVPDFQLKYANGTYVPFLVGLPFVGLFLWFSDRASSAETTIEPEANEIDEELLKAAIRNREAEHAAMYEDPNSPLRIRQQEDYYLQVWEKIWEKFGKTPFTTDDVQDLGNTYQEANEVLIFIKDWGFLRTVGLRTFEIDRGPPDIESILDDNK